MQRFNFLGQIRAAQNLNTAFEYNRAFSKKDLETLGLPTDISERFKK